VSRIARISRSRQRPSLVASSEQRQLCVLLKVGPRAIPLPWWDGVVTSDDSLPELDVQRSFGWGFVLIADSRASDIPDHFGDDIVVATSTAVAVLVRHAQVSTQKGWTTRMRCRLQRVSACSDGALD
jgi:hypothetical protein